MHDGVGHGQDEDGGEQGHGGVDGMPVGGWRWADQLHAGEAPPQAPDLHVDAHEHGHHDDVRKRHHGHHQVDADHRRQVDVAADGRRARPHVYEHDEADERQEGGGERDEPRTDAEGAHVAASHHAGMLHRLADRHVLDDGKSE